MNSENLHLYLGLTKNELNRRVQSGTLDLQAILSQIQDYSSSLKLNAITEQWLEDNKSDQVDRDSIPDNVIDFK